MGLSQIMGQKAIRSLVIAWVPPLARWIKLNSDGAFKASCSSASCGGLLKGSFGKWLVGYAKPLKTYLAFQAECWGYMWSLICLGIRCL